MNLYKPLIWIALFVVGSGSFLNGNVEFQRAKIAHSASAKFDHPLELPLTVFPTLAADLVWIETLIKYGENKRFGGGAFDWMIPTGHRIADLDPEFRVVYDHVPAMAFAGRNRLREEELEEINQLVLRGASVFKDDPQLPFSAAMNYIGYSDGSDTDRRVRELEKGIEYLRESLERRPNAEAMAVLNWFLTRLSALRGQGRNDAERVRILRDALDTAVDHRLRRILTDELRILGVGNEDTREQNYRLSYLPFQSPLSEILESHE